MAVVLAGAMAGTMAAGWVGQKAVLSAVDSAAMTAVAMVGRWVAV